MRQLAPVLLVLSCAVAEAQVLTGLRVEGPTEVPEESTALYRAIAVFDSGWEYDVTLSASLWVYPGWYASIGVFGDLATMPVEEDTLETLRGQFSFGEQTVEASLGVTIRDVPPAGFALEFDGVNDEVATPDNLIRNRPALTLEAWFRTTGYGVIFGYQNSAYPASPSNFAPVIYVGTDGLLRGQCHSTIGTAPAVSDEIVNDDLWHHVALTAEDGMQILYVDGEPVDTIVGGSLHHLDMSYNQIGLGFSGNPWPGIPHGWNGFEGRIDEVRLWSVVHTANEIAEWKNWSLVGDEPGLLGYWRFDEGWGQVAADSTQNGFDGVLGTSGELSGDDSDPVWALSGAPITDEPLILHVAHDAAPGGDGLSWGSALPSLQDALAFAQSAPGVVQEIWVGRGVYTPAPPGGDETVSFELSAGAGLYGGFAGWETQRDERDPTVNLTVLSGDLNGDDLPEEFPTGTSFDDNSDSVVRLNTIGATSSLDGFLIIGGNDFGGYSSGGGVQVSNATVVLSNCTLARNAAYSGGAAFVTDGTLELHRCTVERNVAPSDGGGVTAVNSLLSLQDCVLADNDASGSSGGAVSATDATLEAQRCTFRGNAASIGGGGLATLRADVLLESCLLADNETLGAGGAGWTLLGTSTLRNCTVYRNTALGSTGGGLSCVGGGLTVMSCLFWANADNGGGGEAAQINATPVTVNHSCVDGWTGALGGTGNFGDDPQLADPVGLDGLPGTDDDNLRLTIGSACIDAGDPDFVPDPLAVDLDGRPRVLCSQVDVGAYEGSLGDFNCDRAVDMTDYTEWPACFCGPGGGPCAVGCESFDFDADGDVDLADFARFAHVFGTQ